MSWSSLTNYQWISKSNFQDGFNTGALITRCDGGGTAPMKQTQPLPSTKTNSQWINVGEAANSLLGEVHRGPNNRFVTKPCLCSYVVQNCGSQVTSTTVICGAVSTYAVYMGTTSGSVGNLTWTINETSESGGQNDTWNLQISYNGSLIFSTQKTVVRGTSQTFTIPGFNFNYDGHNPYITVYIFMACM